MNHSLFREVNELKIAHNDTFEEEIDRDSLTKVVELGWQGKETKSSLDGVNCDLQLTKSVPVDGG